MMKKRTPYRFIFAGGGTGGHLYPALAVAQQILEMKPEAEILCVGAKNKIEIMPGGGVNKENARIIINLCGAKEIHASAREKKDSSMKFRNSDTSMSDSSNMPEYEIMVTSSKRIRAIKESIK